MSKPFLKLTFKSGAAKLYTREEIDTIRKELVPKLGAMLDGHPSLVNVSVLIEMLLLVGEDCELEKQTLIDMVAASADLFYRNHEGETKQ
jgi:hypothetical protein